VAREQGLRRLDARARERDGMPGMVAVGERRAHQTEDAVTGEVFDGAPGAGRDLADGGVVALDDVHDLVRRRRLDEGGEAAQIEGHHGDLAATLLERRGEPAITHQPCHLGRQEASEELLALSAHDVVADRPHEQDDLAERGRHVLDRWLQRQPGEEEGQRDPRRAQPHALGRVDLGARDHDRAGERQGEAEQARREEEEEGRIDHGRAVPAAVGIAHASAEEDDGEQRVQRGESLGGTEEPRTQPRGALRRRDRPADTVEPLAARREDRALEDAGEALHQPRVGQLAERPQRCRGE